MKNRSQIKFGILGCSRIAQKNTLPAMQSSASVRLAMVGSRDPLKAKEVAEKFNGEKWGAYDEVLQNPDIDAVYISLPNSLHEEWTIKAARAGKHVICEKPAATSYAAAKNMVLAAEENGVRLLEGFMFRYHPQHAEVKKLIKNGALGDILRFEGCFGYSMPDPEKSEMRKELHGGSLHATGCYPIAASRMIFEEEPESIFAKFKIDPESGIDVQTDIILHYPNGKTALASSLFGSYYQSTYSVLGSKACVKLARAYAVPRDMETKLYFEYFDADDKVRETIIAPTDHFQLMLDDFCAEIIKGDSGVKKYEADLLAQARVIEAAKLSNQKNRPIKISEIK